MDSVDLLLVAAGLSFCLALAVAAGVVELGTTPEPVAGSEPVVVYWLNASEAEGMLDAAVREGRYVGSWPDANVSLEGGL